MSCSTCHDVHATRTAGCSVFGPMPGLSSRGELHRIQRPGLKIADNCIDCHMPEQPTNAIVSQTAGKVVRATMRTHWIRVYPETNQP